MITPDEAIRIILEHARPLRTSLRPLGSALGYCLAEDVAADRDMPASDRSAMDGYAVRAADLAGCPCRLRLVGESAAGKPFLGEVEAGACVRILTGAVVPAGADAVVMVEHSVETGDVVIVRRGVAAGENIRKRGEEARAGEVVLPAGTVLTPSRVAVCAAVGAAEPLVWERPSIAIACTGEELCPADSPALAHEQRNSNGPALWSALNAWGFDADSEVMIPDKVDVLSETLHGLAGRHDVVLANGGVSVGVYDFVPEAVRRIGGRIHLHGVAIKPGKPMLYATLPNGAHFFGLPGNPVSMLNDFHEFVVPALRRMAGIAADECRWLMRLPLAEEIAVKPGRVQYLVAALQWGQAGPVARRVPSLGSSDVLSGGRADGTIVVPAGVSEVAAGALVDFRPWRPLL